MFGFKPDLGSVVITSEMPKTKSMKTVRYNFKDGTIKVLTEECHGGYAWPNGLMDVWVAIGNTFYNRDLITSIDVEVYEMVLDPTEVWVRK